MYNKDIDEKLTVFCDTLREEFNKRNNSPSDGYAYTLGFFQSFMARVLTAYVPANLRHELIDMIDKRTAELPEDIKKLEYL